MTLILFVQGLYHKIRTTILGVVVSDKSNSNLTDVMKVARRRQMQDAKSYFYQWILRLIIWLLLVIAGMLVLHNDFPRAFAFIVTGCMVLGILFSLCRYLDYKNNSDHVVGRFDSEDEFWDYWLDYVSIRDRAREYAELALVSIILIVSYLFDGYVGVDSVSWSIVSIVAPIVAMVCGFLAIKRRLELRKLAQK